MLHWGQSQWKNKWSLFPVAEVKVELQSCCMFTLHHLSLSSDESFCHMLVMRGRLTGRGQTRTPSNTSYLSYLISSELFSMPPIKRFSVSFARHPTNGMSAFIQVSLLLSCMIFWWGNVSVSIFDRGNSTKRLPDFLSEHTRSVSVVAELSPLTPPAPPVPAAASTGGMCSNQSPTDQHHWSVR